MASVGALPSYSSFLDDVRGPTIILPLFLFLYLFLSFLYISRGERTCASLPSGYQCETLHIHVAIIAVVRAYCANDRTAIACFTLKRLLLE